MLGWAKRKKRRDGSIEEIIGIHFLRPKEELISRLKKQKVEEIYKKIRNPDMRERIEDRVDRRYNKGKYQSDIFEFSRSILHKESRDELGDKKIYYSDDRRAGIAFLNNSCQGSMKYDALIPEFPKTGLEDIFKEIDGTYREAYSDDEDSEDQIKPPKKLSKKERRNLKKKVDKIFSEIDRQDKKYTFNFAVRLLIETDTWDSANNLVEEYTSFINDKLKMDLVAQRCINEEENKIRVLYLFHITEPKIHELEKNSIMNEQIDKIVKRELMKKPGKGEDKIRKKISGIYQKKYWGDFSSLPTLFNTAKRNRLMKDIKMGVLEKIYIGIAERIIKRSKNKDFSYNEISGNPYSSIIFTGPKIKGAVRILPYYSSLKDEMPNWEWLDLNKEHKSELERSLEDRGTYEWLKYLERQNYLGTQVIGIKYKKLEDRNYVLNNYSLLPFLFEEKYK